MSRTTLDFEYNGRDYSLAYTIDVVKRLDRSGILAEIANGNRPLTMTEDLFKAAFDILFLVNRHYLSFVFPQP